MQPYPMLRPKHHNHLCDIALKAPQVYQRTISSCLPRVFLSHRYKTTTLWDIHGSHYPNPAASFQASSSFLTQISYCPLIKKPASNRNININSTVRPITYTASPHVSSNTQYQQEQAEQLVDESNLNTAIIMEAGNSKAPPSPSSSSSVIANASEGENIITQDNPESQQQESTTSSLSSSSSSKEKPPTKEQESPPSSSSSATATQTQESPAPLPPLTPAEHKAYNRLAVQMDYFHDHFRSIWKTLYTACTNNKRPANLTLKQFIDEGLRLTQYLDSHHSIEETYLYPILARKMPQFRAAVDAHSKKGKGKGQGKDGAGDCDLLKQHQEIHKGMDVFNEYLKACKNREVELELSVLKEKMDSWGDVLFKHLDDEVRQLQADSMRKYWTLDEVKAIPI